MMHTPDCGRGHCALCGDEAVLARVVSVDPITGTAEVAGEGVTGPVALDLVDGVAPGDAVLVHQGFAISRMDDA